MRVVLSIAGSDPSGGAGVQADLKTFAALGVYGTSVITALTMQNTKGVAESFISPPAVTRSQLDCLLEDITPAAIKTGMLGSPENVAAIADAIQQHSLPNVVVDPVMLATGGPRRTLLPADAVSILKVRLLPLAAIATPNAAEARALTGITVASLEDARNAAKRIVDLGAKAVVVKGGHIEGSSAVDLLFDGHTFTEFSAPRSANTVHGAGCAFAAAIAAGLALGDDVAAAVDRAKRYITGAIEHSVGIGSGARVLNHFWLY
jgi:hydroxymethylpyrimidine/phosphomethylpyrimidine kinase